MRNRLLDASTFWGMMGTGVGAVAALPIIVGLNRLPTHKSVLSSGWLVAGGLMAIVAIFALHRAAILFMAHRHAEQHMCPNPDAHRLVVHPSALWPPPPVLPSESPVQAADAVNAPTQALPPGGGAPVEPPRTPPSPSDSTSGADLP